MFFLKLINRILLLNFLTYHYKRWYIKVSPMSIFHRILLLKSTSVMFFYFVIWLHFELCTWKAKWSKRMNEHSHWICTIKTPTIWLAFGEGEKNITGWGKNSDWRAVKMVNGVYVHIQTSQCFEVYVRKLVLDLNNK